MRRLVVLLAALLTLVAWTPSSGAEADVIVVVVNKAHPAARLTRDQLRPIFKTQTTRWPNEETARPVNLKAHTSTRKGFDAAVLGLDPERVKRSWIDRKVRGGNRPPVTAPSPSKVLAHVRRHPGAIGYVRHTEADRSVKIVAKIIKGEVLAP
jgi:ABC-type phosphate transport system substrate-binding protein